MCYHATYLFSHCGHISISTRPLKQAQPCSAADNATIPSCPSAEGRAPETPNSVHAIESPSSIRCPERFAFPRHHDPIPASPTSPLAVQRLALVDFELLDAYSPATVSQPQSRPILASRPRPISLNFTTTASPCPLISSHPLHTYTLPLLCPACQRARLENIAHFEAQAIKQILEREEDGKNGSGASLVDPEREKAVRHSRAKRSGELIPLICVEEARILESKRQQEYAQKAKAKMEDGGENVNIDVRHVHGAQIESGGEQEPVRTQKRQERHSRPVSMISTVSSSWASWWTRSTTVSRPSSPIPAKTAPSTPTKAPEQAWQAKGRKGGGHRRAASSISAQFEIFASPRPNVPRDMFGRNLKGMKRIMEWSSSDGGWHGQRK